MVDKRHKKVDAMLKEMEKPWVFEPECTYVLTGWGSSKGSIKEAAEILHEEGYDVGALVFKDIWPMDEQAVSKIIADKKLIMVEQNATCQLGRLIRQQTGAGWFDAVLKYDGRPLFPAHIVERARKIMEQ
jgi:2-oxoglutarate ferredoxin oxidoreductase subunit alpha